MPALSLPALEVAERLGRLRPLMAEAGVDALMVTSLFNVRYLTGFTGSAGTVVVYPEDAVLVTDGRYATQSAEQLSAAGVDARIEIVTGPGQKDLMISLVPPGTRLGLEAAHVSWARQRVFATEWYAGCELVPTTGLVEGLRRVKDPGERARVARAAAIADRALGNVFSLLEEGPTEAAFALALDTEMRRLGADEPSFDTIVAAGPNSAKPHHHPSERVIGRGEPVVIDFGARVDGYCSDMTRTVSVGELDDPELRRVYGVVAASQAAGVAAVRAGVRGAD
ncbi:MAG: M24 family metallopeptidase, partial [Acidimicrobiales bacterium]